jgi:hypothetical protein
MRARRQFAQHGVWTSAASKSYSRSIVGRFITRRQLLRKKNRVAKKRVEPPAAQLQAHNKSARAYASARSREDQWMCTMRQPLAERFSTSDSVLTRFNRLP